MLVACNAQPGGGGALTCKWIARGIRSNAPPAGPIETGIPDGQRSTLSEIAMASFTSTPR